MHFEGAGWGFDALFATAGGNLRHYTAAAGETGRAGLAGAPVCAVVVGGSTMSQLNRGVLKAAVGRGEKWYLNPGMLAMVTQAFPTFFHKGFLSPLASPINGTGRVLHQRAAGTLDAECLVKRKQL